MLSHGLKFAAALGVVFLHLHGAKSADGAMAILKNKQGGDVGSVELVQTEKGVVLRLNLKSLPAGERAFHIHETGKCEAPFESAGGHFNPGKHKHGKSSSAQAHAGDMPNITIPENGQLTVEVLNTAVTLEKGKPNSVLQTGGTSIVIHAGKDDYKTDPDGNAGDRIACGVIQAGK